MKNEWRVVIFSIICLLESVRGIRFTLQPNTQKCLRDEMNANMLVVGWVMSTAKLAIVTDSLHNLLTFSEYEVSAAPNQIIDYEVRDTKQHILSKKDDVSRGKFSFTSEVFDVYELCFISKVSASELIGRRFVLELSKYFVDFRRSRNTPRGFGYGEEGRWDEIVWGCK